MAEANETEGCLREKGLLPAAGSGCLFSGTMKMKTPKEGLVCVPNNQSFGMLVICKITNLTSRVSD